MNDKKSKNFILICDTSGNLIEQMPHEFIKNFKKGENLLEITDPGFHNSLFDFIIKIKKQEYVLGYEMAFLINGESYLYDISGYIKDGVIHISCLGRDEAMTKILKEIISINNKQMNQLRQVYKENAMIKATNEDDIYTEISKLNSELLNSKRTIQKQNAELSDYNRLLKNIAMKDHLTSAYNRRYFYEILPDISKRVSGKNSSLIMATLDLNNFKKVNDILGHDFGDKVLVSLVDMIKENIGSEDLVFRLGGDEFLVLFVNRTMDEAAQILRKVSEQYKKISDISSLAYGIVEIPLSDEPLKGYQIDHYLKMADGLMYEHKTVVK